MLRWASKYYFSWISQLCRLKQVASECLPLVDVVQGTLCHAFWDEAPIVLAFHIEMSDAANHNICIRPPPYSALSNPPTPSGNIYTHEVSQRQITLALRRVFVSNALGSLQVILQRRFCASLQAQLPPSGLQFDRAYGIVKQLPAHVALVWIKTLANGWCTSTRFHEKVRFSCLFGCCENCDELKHYLQCSTLVSVCASALKVSVAETWRFLSDPAYLLGLHMGHRGAFYLVCIMFSVYHAFKRLRDTGGADGRAVWERVVEENEGREQYTKVCVEFSRRDCNYITEVAKVHVTKLQSMIQKHALAEVGNSRPSR